MKKFKKLLAALLLSFSLTTTSCSFLDDILDIINGTETSDLDIAKDNAKTYLETYKSLVDYRDNEKTIINSYIQEGKDAIDACNSETEISLVKNEYKDKLDSVKTNAQYEQEAIELANAISSAESTIRAYFDEADYRSAEVLQLRDIVAQFVLDIQSITTLSAVSEKVTATQALIDAVKTDAEYVAEELAEYKETVIDQLNEYISDTSIYRDEEKEEIVEILENGAITINAQLNIEAVDNKKAEIIAALDSVETEAEYNARILAEKKIAAITELNSYVDLSDYRVAQQTQISTIIADYTDLINAANSTNWVSRRLGEAKTAIDNIKTDAELTEAEKLAIAEQVSLAKTELGEYYAAFNLELYRAEQKTELLTIYNNSLTALDNATTSETVQNIISTTKTNLNAVKTDAILDEEELDAYKLERANTLRALYSEEKLALYREEQQEYINSVIDAAIERWMGYAAKGPVTTKYNKTVETLASVKTDAQLTVIEAETLIANKASAKIELASYLDKANYRSAQQDEIDEILSTSSTQIDTVTRLDDLETLILDIKDQLNGIPTDLQLTAAEALANAKQLAKDALTDSYNVNDYYEAQLLQIQNIIDNFESEIDSILTEASLNEAKASALKLIKKVKTKAQIDAPVATYDPENYYDGYYVDLVSWTDSEDLVSQLHDIISGGTYQALPFTSPNWETNIYADQNLYDFEYLDAVYSTENMPKDATNNGWQREHAFCASLMCGTDTGSAVKTLGRATDFHNLFAARSTGNTARGNKNFGEVDNDVVYTTGSLDTSKQYYTYLDYKVQGKTNTFEPSDYDKGRLARAIFYMTIMYNEDVYDPNSKITMKALTVVEDNVDYVAGNNCAFAHGNLSTLLSWATTYDVDLVEYQHNESVYSHVNSIVGYAQGNRNPLVDYPELIEYIYGDKKDTAGELKYLKPSYESLGIGEDNFGYYALSENTKKNYLVNETFKTSDIEVIKVGKDLTTSVVNNADLVISGVSNNEVLSSVGNKTINVTVNNETLTYILNVANSDPIATSSYSYTFSKTGQLGDATDTEDISIKLGSLNWTRTLSGGKIGSYKTGNGMQIGSSDYPVSTLTLVTNTSISNIKSISLKGVSTSGNEGVTVEFYVGSNKVYSEKLDYINDYYTDCLDTITYKLPSVKSGKVTIKITNSVAKGYYLYAIAINN